MYLIISLLSWLTIASSAQAEQYKTLGNWDVHYIVLNSTFLQPEIARQYQIQRSKYNAFVNISVLDHDSKQAQNVAITGTATNLLGTIKELTFEQVQEQDSIYYLAQLPFRDRETFRFSIDIVHGNEKQTLTFKQELVTD
ncbi:DUF4426 domain-containing protein [Paraneptunicella aestuarii]|nr:DUF4426 domain-containing protein [Paraneptunicella aestuarii]